MRHLNKTVEIIENSKYDLSSLKYGNILVMTTLANLAMEYPAPSMSPKGEMMMPAADAVVRIRPPMPPLDLRVD